MTKGFRFPTPQLYYSKKRKSSFQKSIIRYAIKVGLRYQNLHRDDITAEKLAPILEHVIRVVGGRWMSTYGGKHSFSADDAERMAGRAAETAVGYWDESHTARHRLRSRAGGRAPRKVSTRKYTVADLTGLDQLSKAAQAKALGCSESTVATLRRERKEASADTQPLPIRETSVRAHPRRTAKEWR